MRIHLLLQGKELGGSNDEFPQKLDYLLPFLLASRFPRSFVLVLVEKHFLTHPMSFVVYPRASVVVAAIEKVAPKPVPDDLPILDLYLSEIGPLFGVVHQSDVFLAMKHSEHEAVV